MRHGGAPPRQRGSARGFLGKYLYDGARWTSPDPAEQPELTEPSLLVDIYDSDIAGAEIFVEVKTRRFLMALGLPLPDGLPRP